MKKFLAMMLVIFMLFSLLACSSIEPGKFPGSESTSEEKGTTEGESTSEGPSPDENEVIDRFLDDVGVTFGDGEQYIIEYVSNGDGTCTVSNVLMNPYNTQDIHLAIPEKSPKGDTVVGISTTLAAPDCGVPPIMTQERFDAMSQELGNLYGLDSLIRKKVVNYYKSYNLTEAINETYYDQMLAECPIIDKMPCFILDSGAPPVQLASIANIMHHAKQMELSEYLRTYYELLDLADAEETAYLKSLWDIRNALKNPTCIRSVEMPDSVEWISEMAFMGCSSLIRVTLSENLTSIPDGAFAYAGIVEIDIPDRVTHIDNAFESCYDLVRVEIGEGVTSIEKGTFEASRLWEIQNRSALRFVSEGESAEEDVDVVEGVKHIYADESEESKLVWNADCVFYVEEETGEYDLIGYFGNKENVVLPPSVLGQSYQISDRVFMYERNLRFLEIGNGVTHIAGSAFGINVWLESVRIGANVEKIGERAFGSYVNIKSFEVDSANPYYDSFEGCLYSEGREKLIQYALGSLKTEFSVPDGVKEIVDYAFEGAVRLERLTIPSSLEKTHIRAFLNGTTEGCTFDIIYHGTQDEWFGIVGGSIPCPPGGSPGEPGLSNMKSISVSCTDGDMVVLYIYN